MADFCRWPKIGWVTLYFTIWKCLINTKLYNYQFSRLINPWKVDLFWVIHPRIGPGLNPEVLIILNHQYRLLVCSPGSLRQPCCYETNNLIGRVIIYKFQIFSFKIYANPKLNQEACCTLGVTWPLYWCQRYFKEKLLEGYKFITYLMFWGATFP